jgi:hypothetical protein
MDGSATTPTEGHSKAGRLVAGHTEWQARKLRLAALVEQLSHDYDTHSAIAQQLVQVVAVHLDQASRTRNSTIRARSTRLIAKLLNLLERRPAPPKPGFSDLLTSRDKP